MKIKIYSASQPRAKPSLGDGWQMFQDGDSWYVEIEEIQHLFDLAAELGEQLIISDSNNSICIYDSYIE
jgi:hypothetical protein